MTTVLVVAPHPDDETLGCGGTILRHIAEKDEVHWVIVTSMTAERGFLSDKIAKREKEIEQVASLYGFAGVHRCGFPTSRLDHFPVGDIVSKISAIVNAAKPTVLYVPHRGDVHTDHATVFDSVAACTKWFRFKSVRRVLSYETISETDFGINPDSGSFRPNVFSDISDFIEKKITIMKTYDEEIKPFPFPRSEGAVRALATLRGAAAGFNAAEAFMLLKEIR